jgi:hypothetical protein
VFVVFTDVVIDGLDEFRDDAECAVADSFSVDFREPAFDESIDE